MVTEEILIYSSNVVRSTIAQGYGVLYGDESTEPKTNIVDAYGYQEDQAYYFGGSAIKDRGIRGAGVRSLRRQALQG